LAVKRLDGTDAVIAYTTLRATVLHVFSPNCGWCERNLPNIATLADSIGGRFDVYGVSLTDKDVDSYVRSRRISYPVVVASDEARVQYKLGGTPQTLVVAPGGRLIKNWRGAYQTTMLNEVESFFGVVLPGLSKEAGHKESTGTP